MTPSRTQKISSLSNPRVQLARKLKRRASRDREGAFLIEGPNVIAEALDAGVSLTELFVCSDDPDVKSLVDRARGSGTAVHEVDEKVLDAIADSVTPQGLIAIAELPRGPYEPSGDLALVLAEVRDPGNAGTLIRSAVAAGAQNVVFSERCVDPFGPKTVRSSAGAIFRARVVRDAPLKEGLARFKEAGFKLVAADAGSSTAANDADLSGRVALVLGNESWGLSEEAAGLVDEVVGIQMPGPAESLNVAIAGSILLFECVRQRRLS